MELTQKLDCKDLHGYVLTLPSSVLDQLYAHPATCLAIFRLVDTCHVCTLAYVEADDGRVVSEHE